MNSSPIKIETERLILREILPLDENGLFELDSDPDVHRYLGQTPVKDTEQIKAVIQFIRQQYIDHGIGRWAVIEKETNEFVGWSGFKYMTEKTNNHNNYYDLGYRFIKKHWGKGYATETAKASLKYGFTTLNLNEIFATVDIENVASKNVLEKAGLTVIESFLEDGIPHHWLKITREEWLQQQ